MDAPPELVRSSDCLNCGAPLEGRFCASCGQRAIETRITLPGLLRDAARMLFDMESGLPHTVRALTRRPAGTIREYLEGRRTTYTNPVAYLVFFAGLTTVAYLVLGLGEERFQAMPLPELPVLDQAAPNLALLLNVPLMAFWSWIGFGRRTRTYAENLVLSVYAYGHLNALLLLLLPLYFLPATGWIDWAWLGIGLAYYTRIYLNFFEVRRTRGRIKAVFIAMLALGGLSGLIGFVTGFSISFE